MKTSDYPTFLSMGEKRVEKIVLNHVIRINIRMLQGHFSKAILHNRSDKKIYSVADQLLLPRPKLLMVCRMKDKMNKKLFQKVLSKFMRQLKKTF